MEEVVLHIEKAETQPGDLQDCTGQGSEQPYLF